MKFEDKLKNRIDRRLDSLVKYQYVAKVGEKPIEAKERSTKVEKKKFFTKKKITWFSVLGGVVTAGLVVAIVLMNYYSIKYPALKIDKYCVNLSDAESIGIIPLAENKNKSLLVKKNKNTGKLETVNFFSKKNNKPASGMNKPHSGQAPLILDSYDDLVAAQDKLGWVVRNYLVLDGYTFVHFVPKPEYFNTRYGTDDIQYENTVPIPDGSPGTTSVDATKYRIDDFNINHYYDGKHLPFDMVRYQWSRAGRSYIINNETGYIYTTEFVNGESGQWNIWGEAKGALSYYNNMLLFYTDGSVTFGNENTRNLRDRIHGYGAGWFDNSYIVSLDTIGDQLDVKLSKDLPSSYDYFKDRYGQYFGVAMTKEETDYQKKIKIVSKKEWNDHFATADGRFLIVKNNKLYEYVDNFELEEVPDGVTYKCSGYYSDYSFINNEYIFNLSKNYIVDIKNYDNYGRGDFDSESPENLYNGFDKINALLVLNNDYFIYNDNQTLRCIKNPFELYKSFKASHPDAGRIPLVYGQINYEGNQWGFEENNEEYHQLLNDNSVALSDVIKWKFKTEDDMGYTYIQVDQELIVTQWDMEGNKEFAVQINDAGEVEFVEIDKYTPKQFEYVLSPINI